MKRLVSSFAAFLFVFVAAHTVFAKSPIPPFVEGWTFTGNIYTVAPGQSLATAPQATTATLTITGQQNNLFTATFAVGSAAGVNMAGILGPQNPFLLHMSAPDYLIFADFMKAGRKGQIYIHGTYLTDGSAFEGVLIKQ